MALMKGAFVVFNSPVPVPTSIVVFPLVTADLARFADQQVGGSAAEGGSDGRLHRRDAPGAGAVGQGQQGKQQAMTHG